MNALLDELNPQQRKAVLTTNGPVLILAGPGAGKTKTLTYRIAYLLQTGVAPDHILAVTFTNKAAREMRSRLQLLIPHLPLAAFHSRLFVGTFHSLCVRILQANAQACGYSPQFSIVDKDDSLSLMKAIGKELAINPKQFPPGMIATTISRLKSELVSPEQYIAQDQSADQFGQMLGATYAAYQKRLRQSNAMDFDDLLMNTAILFEQNPQILERYQEQFHYIHVDEWQDTNHAQYMLIRALAQRHRNIAVVGDDAQAIYSFRGADFRNILDFEKDWPDATIIVLDQNYRSTRVILAAATHVIGNNREQREKKLWTERQEGDRIALAAVEDERAEAQFVTSTIHELCRTEYQLKDIVVLYRTNAQSRAFEEAFLEHRLPYVIIGGLRFFQRKEVKDVLAYVRTALNPQDTLSMQRIINVPNRGIGKKTLDSYLRSIMHPQDTGRIVSDAPDRHIKPVRNQMKESSVVSPLAKQTSGGLKIPLSKQVALAAFQQMLEHVRSEASRTPASEFLKYLVQEIGYRPYLEESFTNAEERWQNIQELVSLARQYDADNAPGGMVRLLEDAILAAEQEDTGVSDNEHGRDPTNVVHLMTLHAAKGLEFPVVFMTGLEEGIFPHSRSQVSPLDLEEERRLCYVGLTRAKERVYLSFALRRMQFGMTQANMPSRFLREIPEELLTIQEQDSLVVDY